MSHLTRYGKKMKTTLIGGITGVCAIGFIFIPCIEKRFLNNEVGYYSILFNGSEIGSANSMTEAQDALASARLKFSQNFDSIVYMDNSISIEKKNKLIGSRMSQDELADAIYTNMFDCVTDKENATAYTLRINDFTVTLASKEDVSELINRITAKYDSDNDFQVKLTTENNLNGVYEIAMVKSEIQDTAKDIVAAAIDGAIMTVAEDGTIEKNGITSIGFDKDIVVNETLKSGADISTVDQAYEDITKEKAEKTTYTIQAGDCLSTIASKYNLSIDELCSLNNITEDTVIIPDDELIVTVPKPEISVKVTKRETYEEDYNAPVEYVDDDTQYRGTETVLEEGTTGHHKVTADITYVDGVKENVEYVDEQVITESKPKKIAEGTLTPPTYLRPVSGGYVSSSYGYRDGEFHKGVDICVGTGTSVRAASSGTVIRAGWYSGYGLCVDIRHEDGSMTRYGHLSRINVSNGQHVDQSQQIALSGSTGNSSGPHLHFEIWINGNTVNPLNYVNKN